MENNDSLTIGAELVYTGDQFDITNVMTTGTLVTGIIFILVILSVLFSKKEGAPTKFQVVLEMLIEGFHSFVEQIAGSEKIAKKILPIVGSVFIYLGIANIILLLIPGIGAFETIEGTTIFRTLTADFSSTLGLSVAVVIWTHILSIFKFNIFVHINKYIKVGTLFQGFKKGIGPGMIAIIEFLIGFLDIISEFAKALSLSLRLFGNMFAGELLAFILFSAIPLGAPSVLILMGLFTGTIQAVVFGALTSSYFGAALTEE